MQQGRYISLLNLSSPMSFLMDCWKLEEMLTMIMKVWAALATTMKLLRAPIMMSDMDEDLPLLCDYSMATPEKPKSVRREKPEKPEKRKK